MAIVARRSSQLLVAALLVGVFACATAHFAQATPTTSFTPVTATGVRVEVYSPSMGRTIPLDILRSPGTAPAPTLYLLNGAGGGEDSANWIDQGGAESFFAGKHVNVVIPRAGAFSYYTDWLHDDPALGRQRWETFLTRELPAAVAAMVPGTGRAAVAGLSMSGSAALALAERHPGQYGAVASFSGCPNTSGALGAEYVRLTVEGRGAASVTNMWGQIGGPDWIAHDAEVNAGRLSGTNVFVSAGTGLPGAHDNTSSPQQVAQMAVGGPIEVAVRDCSVRFVDRLHQAGIPVDTYFPDLGTHSFAYWNDALTRAWPTLWRGLSG